MTINYAIEEEVSLKSPCLTYCDSVIRLFHSILVDSNKEDAANLKLKVSVWNPRNLLPSWKQGNMDDTDVKMKIQLVSTINSHGT